MPRAPTKDGQCWGAQAYGVAVESGPLPNQRAVFVIDGEGIVRYTHIESASGQYQGVGPELEALRQVAK